MPCTHLRQLYEVCQSHNLKLSSSDLIRIVCPTCGVEDVCPSILTEEFERRHEHDPPGEPAEREQNASG